MTADPFVNLVERTIEMMELQTNDLRKSLNYAMSGDVRALTKVRPARSDPLAAVQQIRRARALRDAMLPRELFSDPGWDILLYLYEAHCGRRDIPVSDLAIIANIPATTGLRWISLLEKRGIVYKEHDPDDGRRMFVRLSEEWCDNMREIVVRMVRSITEFG